VRTFEQLLVYNVYAFNGSKLYIATFYKNILQNEKSYLQSKFVGNASAGNFTVKTVGVHLHDGGVYMLGYKEGSENINTEHCSVLFIIGKFHFEYNIKILHHFFYFLNNFQRVYLLF
jgi:hypothetical protein